MGVSVDLSHFETHIHFSEKVNTPALSVFRTLTGKTLPKAGRPHEPGIRIRNAQQKCLVLWNYDSCEVVYEDILDHNSCIKNTVELLDKINNIVPMPEVDLKRLEIHWIIPVAKYDFKSLEQKYREYFFKQYPIFDNCVDSSAIIDMRHNNSFLHHQSGAMNIAQLQDEFRAFPLPKSEHKLFLFLMTTVESSENVKYSNKRMKEFLDNSFEMCKNHSALFQSMMEEIL